MPSPSGGAGGAGGAGGSGGGYIADLNKANEAMKAFTIQMTKIELDMKMFENAQKAAQGAIQGMPA